MFTGIVQEMGELLAVETTRSGTRFAIGARRTTQGLQVGDSVSVAGVCLTVVGCDAAAFSVDVVPETSARTTLAARSVGHRVNLERAARPDSFLSGHLVQGHVDGTTTVRELTAVGEGLRLRFALPPALARYIAEKGSVAIDGASLTVASLTNRWFEIALIPHTVAETTLGGLVAGDAVNLEVDIIAKYVERLLGSNRP